MIFLVVTINLRLHVGFSARRENRILTNRSIEGASAELADSFDKGLGFEAAGGTSVSAFVVRGKSSTGVSGISLNAANCPWFPGRLGVAEFNDCGEFAGYSDKSGMIGFTKQIEQLPGLMNVAELRHRVISQNLANVNTPGYERLDVEFEQALSEAMQNSGKGRSESVEARIITDDSLSARADGNNVDVDLELGQLNKNAMLFQMSSQLLKSQFDAMRRAIESPR